MSRFRMPYRIYGKTDYEINLNKDERLNNRTRGPSQRFNLNKPDARNFNLNKPSEDAPEFNPRRKPPTTRRNQWRIPFYQPVEAQPGMVPIFNTPFYMTPNEPIDPRDCDRYSNSPYCGGTGFNNSRVDIGIDLVFDNCNVGIQLSPTLIYVHLPDFQYVYRSTAPECHPPPRQRRIPSGVPGLNFPDIDPNLVVWAFVSTKTTEVYFNEYYTTGKLTDYKRVFETRWKDIRFPSEPRLDNRGRVRTYPVSGIITQKGEITGYEIDNDGNERLLDGTSNRERLILGGSDQNRQYILIPGNGQIVDHGYSLFETINTAGGQGLYFGAWGLIKQFLIYCYDGIYSGGVNPNNYSEHEADDQYIFIENRFEIRIDRILDLNGKDIPLFRNPPPPPPPPPPCCMGCCPPSSNNDQLLRLLLQKVNKLSEIVGINEYPASLPQTLVTTDANGSTNRKVEIPNLTQLLGWYIERFDEIVGQWEVAIDIEDADAIEEGNQSLKVRVPNIAEAISELLMQSINNTINTEALVSLTTRTLIEAGMNKQQSFKNYWMLDTLIDYFGFQTKEVSKALALTFKPGEEDLEKLLVEGEIPVKVTELSDSTTFKVNMQDLLQAAAITRAANWRGFNNNGDVKQDFIDLIKGFSSLRKNLSNEQKDENDKDDFDHFLDDAERGFIDTPGITDATNPYGRNLSERPRIRRIGNQTPTEDT